MTSTSSRTDALLRQTRIRFPLFEEEAVRITPIEKGGSDRKFYRVRCAADQPIILVKYTREREENRHYVQIAEFLAAHGICAPKIFFHDPAEGLIWIEDLGETDLWSFRAESWLVRGAFYDSALHEIAKLHALPEAARESICGQLPAEFNAALYVWEQSYFFENCLGRVFGLEASELKRLSELPALHETAERLAARPRVLVHRDFQSQNVIIRNGQAYLIDFQGMRPGLAEYDIASLLYDPYVSLTQLERDELLHRYVAIREANGSAVAEDFAQTCRCCAMQRLMQALGAYGFLGLVKGNRAFLAHIPAALDSLQCLTREMAGLEALLGVGGNHAAIKASGLVVR